MANFDHPPPGALHRGTPTTMNQESMRTQRRKAIWFTAVPIVVTLLLLAAVAFKQQLFVASDRLYTFAESGSGIANGMPLKLQGFVIGSVREITLTAPVEGAPPKVRLTLEVSRDAMRYIGKDSSVRFVQEGLIGQAILEIAHGKDRARRAANGDVLAFERGRSLSEIASDFSAKMQPVLDNVQAITYQLRDPAGDFAQTMKGAKQALARTDETLVALGSQATASLKTTNAILLRAERTMPKLDGILDTTGTLLQRAETTLPKVDGILDQATEVAHSARAMVGQAHGMVEDGGQIVEDASRVTKGALRTWPFSTLAGEAPAQALPVDSQDNTRTFLTPLPAKRNP